MTPFPDDPGPRLDRLGGLAPRTPARPQPRWRDGIGPAPLPRPAWLGPVLAFGASALVCLLHGGAV